LAERLIQSEVRNRIALITLNRPAALNALSLDMIVQLRSELSQFAADASVNAVLIKGAGEKAFCAGGDIRAIYESYQNRDSLHSDFFATEYPLDYLLHAYPKPYIALLDGIVMGGGMGISQGSRLRIVGDVGASYFLSRLAGSLGPYLALTGVQIRAADAVYTGLADVYLPRSSVDMLESELCALTLSGTHRREDWRAAIRDVIQRLAGVDLPPPPLAEIRPAIDQHFAAASVPALLKSLEEESRPQFLEWARRTVDLINTRSPTMLAVTQDLLKRGKSMSLADCLRMELGLVRHCFTQGDFIEGVRATIIDKDNTPVWRPRHIEEVTDASIEAMFADPWAGARHPLANLEGVIACN
jgi:enoyl-CoA hydratase/carnithine racemase